MIEVTDRRSTLEPIFKKCLKLILRHAVPAQVIYVYKIVDPSLALARFDAFDLIQYADGYCGNYGGLVEYLNTGPVLDTLQVTVYTD